MIQTVPDPAAHVKVSSIPAGRQFRLLLRRHGELSLCQLTRVQATKSRTDSSSLGAQEMALSFKYLKEVFKRLFYDTLKFHEIYISWM